MVEKENLKGKVKSVYTTEGNEFTKEYFDENGRLVKKETKYKLFDQYLYNNQGRLISYKVLVLSSGWKESYDLVYDKHGFLTGDGYNEFINDRNGNCIGEIKGYDKNTTIMRKYNMKNQIIEEWYKHNEPYIIHVTTDEGEYDKVLPDEGEHTFFEYNEFGDVILRKKPDLIESITYEYDDKNNWIKCYIVYDSKNINEVITGLSTRIIEYYE